MKRGFAVRHLLALACAALAAFGAARATAQEDPDPEQLERPHVWRVELRFAPLYYPNVDKGFADVPNHFQVDGVTPQEGPPFADVFGTKSRLFSTLEVDRDLWSKFGSVGVGLAASYAEFYGTGFHQTGTSPTGPTYQKAGDGTGFREVQLRALAMYHFDYFVPAGIPIVPFVKAGFDWVYYWNTLSSGRLTPNVNTTGNAQGLVTGLELSLGGALLLDVIDPVISREMYADLGIAHTLLNASYTWQNIQNGPSAAVHSIFGSGPSPTTLNLSAGFFDLGIEVEF